MLFLILTVLILLFLPALVLTGAAARLTPFSPPLMVASRLSPAA